MTTNEKMPTETLSTSTVPSKPIFIYGLINPLSQKVFYVGLTTNPTRRYAEHLRISRRQYMNNPRKTRVIHELRELGEKPEMIILEKTETATQANDREQFWIDIFGGVGDGNNSLTNISPGGSMLDSSSIAKISAGNMGKKKTPEHKKKISNTLQGRKLSDAHKKRIAKGLKGKNVGKKRTEETKRLISESGKGKHSDNGMKGKTHSPDARKKISRANSGTVRTEEQRKVMRERMAGKNAGDANPFHGKKHTPEALEKIRAAAKRRKNLTQSTLGNKEQEEILEIVESMITDMFVNHTSSS